MKLYYDKQLIPLEAEESGLSEAFIKKHEQNMSNSFLYDFATAGYAMYNEDLPPLERLFAAQTRIIRRIAALDKSCVIVGRCSDYILYNNPNNFRIFIHATPEYRTARLSEKNGVTPAQARTDLERTDLARGRHYECFTGREWGNTKYFNLAVDSGMYGVNSSVELIENAIRIWCESREKASA